MIFYKNIKKLKIKVQGLKINGFSLIELLVYVSIFAVVAGLMTSILTTVLRVNQRESASVETSEQLSFVMQTVSRLVRESSNIEIATSSASSALKLKLRMKDSAKDPTCLYLENQAIKLAEGPDAVNPQNCNLSASSSLTSNKVIADKLDFSKISNYPGHDIVSIDIQLTYNSQNPQSQITRNLKSAIARVSAATFDSNLLPGSDNQYEIGFSGNNRWKNIYLSGGINDSIYFSGGNVGMGLITPTAKLYVQQATSGTTTPAGRFEAATPAYIGTSLLADNTLGDSSAYNLFAARTDSDADVGGPFTKFLIRGDGNVGIGTASPFNLGYWASPINSGLHIKGQEMAALLIEGGSGATISLYDQGAGTNQKNVRLVTDDGKTFFATMNDNDTFKDSNVLVIDNNNGNVGIGTAGPLEQLELYKSGGGAVMRFHSPAVIEYKMGIPGGGSDFRIAPTNGNAALGNSLGLSMLSNGNVGIGTTAPQGVLHVKGDLQLENVGIRCQILTQATICAPTWTQLGLNNTRYLCMQCW